MSTTSFMSKDYIHNPIKMLHHLIDAGFTQRQAEAQVEVLTDYADSSFATKKDIEELRFATKRDIEEVKRDLKRDMQELELKLTVKISSIVGVIVGFFYTLDNTISTN